MDVARDENTFLRGLLAKVGEKDDTTERLLLEMKTDREVLGETLDRATLDLRDKQQELELSRIEEVGMHCDLFDQSR